NAGAGLLFRVPKPVIVLGRRDVLVLEEAAFYTDPLPCGPIRRVFLAPEAKRFLRGAVRIAEQDAFALGHNVVGGPRRHHEHVVRLEGKIAVAYVRMSMALDDVEYGTVGAAISLTGKSFRHPLNKDGKRRVHVAAVVRVGVAHLDAMRGMQWLVARHTVECLARAGVR